MSVKLWKFKPPLVLWVLERLYEYKYNIEENKEKTVSQIWTSLWIMIFILISKWNESCRIKIMVTLNEKKRKRNTLTKNKIFIRIKTSKIIQFIHFIPVHITKLQNTRNYYNIILNRGQVLYLSSLFSNL